MDDRRERAIASVVALIGYALEDFGYIRGGDEEQNTIAIISALGLVAALYHPVAPQVPLELKEPLDE